MTAPSRHTRTRRPAVVRALLLMGVFALLATLAVVRDGRLFGHTIAATASTCEAADTVTASQPGVINTSDLSDRIIGYAGPVPVEIFTTHGRIDSVRHLPNHETPRFFAMLTMAGLQHSWDGRTLAEAATMDVDAVSGATFSSRAYIANVRAGAARALDIEARESDRARATTIKLIAALIVILAGAVIPLLTHNRVYRLVQQILNAAVLGFWAGTFIDYTVMLGFFANTPVWGLASAITVLLLAVGLIYPLFGHDSHYCTWVCPLGSLQDLAGHLSRRKLHLSPALVRGLVIFRRVLWVALMVMLYAGWGASWIDYELFTAFIVTTASWAMLTAGAVVIVLSVFIPRPYCRFLCPTGTLLRTR